MTRSDDHAIAGGSSAGGPGRSPGPEMRSGAEIEAAIRRAATAGHHRVGTCRMGVDAGPPAALDGGWRVRGIEALRVCDASVFPDRITGNTTAPVGMGAGTAAGMILGRPALPTVEEPPA